MKKVLLTISLSALIFSCTKKNETVAETSAEPVKLTLAEDSLKAIAEETKMTLVKQLTKQIEDSGAAKAIDFCHVNAIPLTQSVADKHGLKVYRVSDKNRNPDNAPNEEELKVIEQYKQQLLAGEQLKPQKTDTHYYAPLVTNAMCLQCHGDKTNNIKPEVASLISEKYPDDKAFGYKENEVRGLVVITSN